MSVRRFDDERDDKEFSLNIRMFAAVAFAPPEHVDPWFRELAAAIESDVPLDFVDYFEDTYMGRLNRNGTRRKARFEIPLWNVYNRTVNDLPRTNNAIEGFHRGFESMLQANKPDVWRFLDAIHKQQALTEFATAQQMGGKMCTKQKIIMLRLKGLCAQPRTLIPPLTI